MAEAKITMSSAPVAIDLSVLLDSDTEHVIAASVRGKIVTATCEQMEDLLCAIYRNVSPKSRSLVKMIVKEGGS